VNDDVAPSPETVHLRLDGFEGPLDLLLDLARRQRVDLARISILTLVEQYLLAVEKADRGDLSRAAEWLVMAAWLTWLKSRLLLPKDTEEAKQAEQAAQVLTERLAQLERVRRVTAWLEARPQLGRDMFERGRTQATPGPVAVADFATLFRACLDVLRGRRAKPEMPGLYQPPRRLFWTLPHAMAQMRAMLEEVPEGDDLLSFLPDLPSDIPDRAFHVRATIATTLLASLELARNTEAALQQEQPFGPITVQPAICVAVTEPQTTVG